jgi:hypothetical protein
MIGKSGIRTGRACVRRSVALAAAASIWTAAAAAQTVTAEQTALREQI